MHTAHPLSMVWCKIEASPLLTNWRLCILALNHRYGIPTFWFVGVVVFWVTINTAWSNQCQWSDHERWQANQLTALQWRHKGRDGVSNHQPHYCLLNCLFWLRSKKTSKLRVTGLCEGNSPVTIWWRHHGKPHQNSMKRESFLECTISTV